MANRCCSPRKVRGAFCSLLCETDRIEASLDPVFRGAFAPSGGTQHEIQIIMGCAVWEQGKIWKTMPRSLRSV